MKSARIATLCAVLLLGTTAAGCSSLSAAGLGTPLGSDDADGQAMAMTTDSGVVLPAGVLPPDSPAAPGDAPLGEDGHYNYDAPEFVLTNPCDDPEIMDRLDRIGYREETDLGTRIDGVKQLGCVIESDNNDVLAVWHLAVPHSRLHEYNGNPIEDSNKSSSWVTFRQTSPIGTSICVSSVETAKGALGFIVDIPDAQSEKPDSELCAPTNAVMIDYLGEM